MPKAESPPTTDNGRAFASSLEDPAQRFTAAALEHGMRVGLRTPADFLRHFSPADIMESLAGRPEPRAVILEHATGMRRAIASHKSIDACATDLQLALEHGAIDPAGLIRLINPDDMANHVSQQRLLRYITESEFWLLDSKAERYEAAKAHTAFLLERGLKERLVSHDEIVDQLSPHLIALHVPRVALGSLLQRALEMGRAQRGFTGEQLVAVVPIDAITANVPLAQIWRAVIAPMLGRSDRGDEQRRGTVGSVVTRRTSDAAPIARLPVGADNVIELIAGEPPRALARHTDSSKAQPKQVTPPTLPLARANATHPRITRRTATRRSGTGNGALGH